MFNLSAIMNEAWASYRRQYSKRVFNRGTFNWLLMLSWKRAKDAALRISNPVLAKVEALREQIEMLSYKSWRIDIVECRRQIEAQIALLTTISATQQQ